MAMVLGTSCLKVPGLRLPVVELAPKPTDALPTASGSRLVLLGDAGYGAHDRRGVAFAGPDPVLTAARQAAAAGPERSTGVVFLGDNVYARKPRVPRAYGGVPPCNVDGCWTDVVEGRVRRLEYDQLLDQLAVAEAGTPVWLILGNHDWYHGTAGVRSQRELTEAYASHHGLDVSVLPRLSKPRESFCDGAAAISVRRVGPELTLIALDTQAGIQCAERHALARETLWKAVAAATSKVVVVAGHHPVRSLGPHGYKKRTTRITGQDIPARRYSRYIHEVLHPPEGFERGNKLVLYASGHDHILEVLEPIGFESAFDLLLVSGAGSLAQGRAHEPIDRSADMAEQDFVSNAPGLMTVDLLPDADEVQITVLKVDRSNVDEGGEVVHTRTLPLPRD